MSVKLSPSILSADFARLGEVIEATEAAGADYIHIDVMDGQFVPPLTIGPMIVEAIRRHTTLPLDVHLMIVEPEKLVADFISAGADKITVHQEAVTHLHSLVQKIRALGASPGVSLNPSTPATTLTDILPDLDLVLAMSVNPGYGGQSFIPSVLQKIAALRWMIDDAALSTELEVDGGIKADNVRASMDAGANVIVAGSAIYNDKMTIAEAVAQMKDGMSTSSAGRAS